IRHVEQAAAPLDTTVKKFGNALGALNYGFNELAYNPGARKPGYLFYLPWLNHDLNATYQLGDATGPLRRGMVLLSCHSASLTGGFVAPAPAPPPRRFRAHAAVPPHDLPGHQRPNGQGDLLSDGEEGSNRSSGPGDRRL